MNKLKKDIFIDNNIAKNFANPVDNEYKKLIAWLLSFDKSKPENENAHLVLSRKILNEYIESSSGAKSNSNITVIVNILIKQGRINEFSNMKIREFQNKYFTKVIEKEYKLHDSNRDRNHIPVVLMSDRKKALTIDKEFTYTLLNFPKFNAQVESKPKEEFYL